METESGFLPRGFSNLMPEAKIRIEKSALKKFGEFHPIAYKFVVYKHFIFHNNSRIFRSDPK